MSSDYTSIGGPIREPHDIFSRGFGPSRLAEMVKPCNVWAPAPDGGPAILITERERQYRRRSQPCNICGKPHKHPYLKSCDVCRAKRRSQAYRRKTAKASTHQPPTTSPAQP